MEGKGKGKVR